VRDNAVKKKQVLVLSHFLFFFIFLYHSSCSVDLAGSERVSKSEASGDRLLEAAAINKSLTALGQVFKSIQTNSPHVPYVHWQHGMNGEKEREKEKEKWLHGGGPIPDGAES
jgi:hypothetical protein